MGGTDTAQGAAEQQRMEISCTGSATPTPGSRVGVAPSLEPG
jgi:hypothetical protein